MCVLIVGLSTRAAAESAARADVAVTALDAFGDLDRHTAVRQWCLPRDCGVPFSARAAVRVARRIECEAVMYLSSFENHPVEVDRLGATRALWGNCSAVLRRVRDPVLLARAIRRRGCSVPAAYGRLAALKANGGCEPAGRVGSLRDGSQRRRWLVKPFASAGGRHVRPWRRTGRLPPGCYLQEFVEGVPGSVVFVAAGGRAVPLGVTRQLVGDPAFGATGYGYCGNILVAAGDACFARDEALVEAAGVLVRAVAEEFSVVGVNGIDFVARDGVPYAIEVNPRWSQSMELVERAYDVSVFAVHAAACAVGRLPGFDLVQARRGARAVGKAVVFARREVVVGDTRTWLTSGNIRDVPHPHERIPARQPVCTVFGEGRNVADCYAALVERATRVYAELDAWTHGMASPRPFSDRKTRESSDAA